jgi:hypothetical protein
MLVLTWRNGLRLQLGEMRATPPMLKYDPQVAADSVPFEESQIVTDAERFDRLFGKAFTRAGWQFPSIDPQALGQILDLRRTNVRLEMILDTNAMVEGIGHWLAALFADRCDLVVTAVTLRELQDIHGKAKFSKPVCSAVAGKPGKPAPPPGTLAFANEAIPARQTYLAAMRFRELTGHQRVLWRELELDDSALLLSRGMERSEKASESDTIMLREVRRHVRDSVRGLERFFVTGDAALARRATTELPSGRTIAARVEELGRGQVYLPLQWWPDTADEGFTITGHTPMRLFWELLAVADSVELIAPDSQSGGWRFSAFLKEMWPSDFDEPWMTVSALTSQPDSPAVSGGGPASEAGLLFASPEVPARNEIPDNLRVSADVLLESLAAIALGRPELPSTLRLHAEGLRHLASLLERLDLARLTGTRLAPLGLAPRLQAAFAGDDRDGVAALLAPYRAFAEQTVPAAKRATSRPERTVELCRRLAERLGQGMTLSESWLPGGANPSLVEVRRAIVERIAKGHGLTIYDLLTDVFLRRLGVSPVRALSAWGRMADAGTFTELEFRRGGGGPDPRKRLPFARLTKAGWKEEFVQLDTFQGYRDVVAQVQS